jgi:transcriptional regulator NrdR family protein
MGQTEVIDSRENANGDRVRRRRECLNCGARGSTDEQWVLCDIDVVLTGIPKKPSSQSRRE